MSDSLAPLILVCGAVTLATRAGGYLILSRFKAIPSRVAAGLDAVPAAVMTTLVAPAALSGGWREIAAFALAILIGLRLGVMTTVVAATAALIAMRAI